MVKITDTTLEHVNIWIGAASENVNNLKDIDAIFNTAQDLCCTYGWPNVEYVQVGLVDGPGNTESAYLAAISALASLVERKKRVMLFCHEGGRSLAIIVMYMCCATGLKVGPQTYLDLLRERIETDLPEVNEAHWQVFRKMDRKVLLKVVEKSSHK